MENIVYEGNINENSVLIRYPQAGDVSALHEFVNSLSGEKTFIALQGEKFSLEEEEKYLKGQLEKLEKGKTVQLLMFLDGKLVGESSINLEEKVRSHVGGFGIMIAKEYRGKGLGKLLMGALLNQATQRIPNLKIIVLEVFDQNEYAIKMYKNFGFSEYGRLPKGLKYKESFSDAVLMYKNV